MYKIDKKKIPLPPDSSGGGVTKYPFREMEIGDSFLIPRNEMNENTRMNIYGLAAKKNIKVSTRISEEGLRVWRIK